jgi:hypothetical protein
VLPSQACCQEAQASRSWGIARQALLQLHQLMADFNDSGAQPMQTEGGDPTAQVRAAAEPGLLGTLPAGGHCMLPPLPAPRQHQRRRAHACNDRA